MTAGARFSLFALLAVVVIGWGLVATTPTPQRLVASASPTGAEAEPGPEAEPEAEPEPEPEAEPEPEPAEPVGRPATVAPGPTPPPAPAVGDPAAAAAEGQPDPERGDVDDRDPVAEAYANREAIIERQVVRYDAARERFANEPRDQAWASEREQALRAIVKDSGIGELLDGVECKSSLCQMRMRFNGLTAAGAATRLAPLAQAIGPDRVLRNEGPPDQRTMVIYVPRDGRWPDEPVEDPALDGK